MTQAMSIQTVAVVGAGLIGQSWAVVFLRAGIDVRIYDLDGLCLSDAPARIEAMLAHNVTTGQIPNRSLRSGVLYCCADLSEAVAAADYIQESVVETIEAKSHVSRMIDAAMPRHAIVGSSSSGIPASAFTEELSNRDRFFIVHPVNPPHLIPAVEIVPAPWSDRSQIPVLRTFIDGLGQSAVVLDREIDGFIMNRLQGALLNEAWTLFADGYASTDDIDRIVRDGLGLRWAFMGPFETIELNAAGGIEDYANRLKGLYHSIAVSRAVDPRPWPDAAVARAATEIAARSGGRPHADRCQERDRKLAALVAHKRESTSREAD